MAKGFFKNIKGEMNKVVWPTKKQLINNTMLVIILVAVIATVVLSFDVLVSFLDTHFWNFVTSRI